MHRSSLRYWLAPFLVLGLAGSEPRSGAPAGEEPPAARPTPAAELWAHPGQSLGREVVLTVQVHSHAETWNPFVTRFGSGEYVCLRAWSDEQFPWRAQDFARPAVRVFARRESAAHWALAEAQRYQRFELTCTVRSVFGGVPWVEVSGVKPLIRQVGDGTVIHASRGMEAFEKRGWSRAKSEFERALVGGIPERGRLELERLIAACDEELAKRVILRPYRPDGER
jgi:hypothetical protein